MYNVTIKEQESEKMLLFYIHYSHKKSQEDEGKTVQQCLKESLYQLTKTPTY